jgi:hypothetical protein
LLALLAFALCALGFGVASATAESPQVTAPEVSEVSYATAHVKGEVDPKDEFTEWFFEVSVDGSNWERTNVEGVAPEGSGQQEFDGDITSLNWGGPGLKPGTTYQVRLSASNGSGFVSSPEPNPEFTTKSVNPPTVTINPVTTFSGTTATFAGTIEPNPPAGEPTAANVDWHFECTPGCPGLEGGTVDAGATGEDQEVEDEAEGLEPNTTYEVTLVGKNAGDPVSDGPVSFNTDAVAPDAQTSAAFVLEGATRALLGGSVNPLNSPSEYWFEYGPTTAYGSSTAHGDAGAGAASQVVSNEVTGLSPGSTYHYRLVSESAAGRTEGVDSVFTTPNSGVDQPSTGSCPNEGFRVGPSAELSECRAYELVSPPDMKGTSVLPIPPFAPVTGNPFSAVANNGNTVLWEVLAAPPGAIDSTGLGDYYRSARDDAKGWQATYVSPPGAALSKAKSPPVVVAGSPDRNRLIWTATEAAIDPADTDPVEEYIPGLGNSRFADLFRSNIDGVFDHLNVGSVEVPIEAENPFAFLAASQDLERVVFSTVRQLEPSAPNGGLYERDGQVTKVISKDENGVSMPNPLSVRFLGASADAKVVAFTDADFNILYLWSAQSDETVRALDVDNGGAQGDLAVDWISANGEKLFLTTRAPLVTGDIDTGRDLYEYNTATGDISLLSAPAGGGAAGNSDMCGGGCDISPVTEEGDGSKVYFVSPETIVPGRGQAGGANLYFATAGEVRFVATLDSADPVYGSTIRNREMRVIANGAELLFISRARLTGYDNAGHSEVYLYDPVSNELTCASCRPDGAPATGDAYLSSSGGNTGSEAAGGLPLSPANADGDGNRIFFSSFDAIVPGDSNGRRDVYVYSVATAAPALISSGTSERNATYLGNGLDGRDVFFLTTDKLTPEDRNGSVFKLYDARSGGGFPTPSTQPRCQGEECQGRAAPPPTSSEPGSGTFRGSGNAKQAGTVHCRKNTRKVRRSGRARCVRKHSKKRNAKGNGRAGR